MSLNDSTRSNPGEGDSIKVAIRVRPRCESDLALCIQADTAQNRIVVNSKPEKVYTFDYVADMDVTQESVFRAVGRTIIDSCMGGYNGTIFAYGQTGSGKTFTMLGTNEDSADFQHELRGIIPRSFEYIFSLIESQKELYGRNVEFLTKCSFLEIYNEQIYDLLDEASNGLQLRENIKKGVFVDGLIEQVVSNAAEAYQVLNVGWVNRTVAATSMNRESSRSHAVFTLSLQSKTLNNGVWNVRCSSLNLVDLAGSERQKDTHTTGVRLKEAGSINKSLSVLGNVIMSLVDIGHGKTRHVPYRDSRLTFLLRDSLGGNAKTCIVACVHPGAKSFGETLSTIHFARRAKMIKNKAVVNEDAVGNVIKLQAEIKRLKEALAQCQAGSVPTEPVLEPLAASLQSALGASATGDSQWRQHFQYAMYFRQQALYKLDEAQLKLQRTDETVKKYEMQLRSKVMILKFRDEAIKKFDRANKEKRELSEDEKDVIIANLRGEVLALQEQLNHAPLELRQSQEEVRALSREVKRLYNTPGVHQLDQLAARELEEVFSKLQAEGQAAPEATPKEKPSSSSATVERQRAQLEELGEEVKRLKQDLQTERSQSEKEAVELKAENCSLRTRNEQLEKILKSQQVSVQVERETMSALHMETIKNLTPKRVRYELRTRSVEGPRTPLGLLNLNEDSPAPDSTSKADAGNDDIFDESMPRDMYSALEDELKSTKTELNSLQARLDARDGEIVNYCSELARSMSEKTQLNEILEKKRCEWQNREVELVDKIAQLKTEINTLQDDKQLQQESIRDLNLMMNGQERSLKEVRAANKALSEEKEKSLADLSTKALKMESELAGVRQALEKEQQEAAALRESEETAQETLAFTRDQLQDKEDELTAKDIELSGYLSEIKDLEKQLEREEERNSDLCRRLEEEGQEKGSQLLDSNKKLKQAQDELHVAQRAHAEAQKAVTSLTERVAVLNQEAERVQKKETELNDAMQVLKSRLYAAKTELESSQAESREGREREAQLSQQVTHLQEVKVMLDREVTDFKLSLEKREGQIDNMQEDITRALEMYKIMVEKTEALTLSTKQLEAENRNLQLELQAAREAQAARETLAKELEALKGRDQERENLAGQYHENINKLQMQLKASSADYATSCEQIESLKNSAKQREIELLADGEAVRRQLQESQSALNSKLVHLQALTDKVEAQERTLQLHTSLLQELDALRAKSACATVTEEEMKTSKEEIARLQSVLEAKQIEMEGLRSTGDHLTEQHNKLKEENKRLLDENAKLVGHNNPNQKIHVLENLKKQLKSEKQENEEMKRKHIAQNQTIEKLRAQLGQLTPSKRARIQGVARDTPAATAEKTAVIGSTAAAVGGLTPGGGAREEQRVLYTQPTRAQDRIQFDVDGEIGALLTTAENPEVPVKKARLEPATEESGDSCRDSNQKPADQPSLETDPQSDVTESCTARDPARQPLADKSNDVTNSGNVGDSSATPQKAQLDNTTVGDKAEMKQDNNVVGDNLENLNLVSEQDVNQFMG